MRGLLTCLAYALLVVASLAPRDAAALDPKSSVLQLKHTSWTVEDGGPPGVNVIAQTPDGYLWLGSDSGLFRFDGIAFEPMPFHTDPRKGIGERVVTLLVTSKGALFVGYSTGGIGIYANGVARHIRPPGMETPTILAMVEDKDGAVWAALGGAADRLSRQVGERWEMVGAAWGLPDDFIQSMLVARDGSLWITMDRQILRLPKGARKFERVPGVAAEGPGIAQDAEGRIWIADTLGARAFATEDGRPIVGAVTYPVAKGNLWGRLHFDRDGNLWGTTFAAGAFRLARDPRGVGGFKPEEITGRQVLSSDAATNVFEDREGNVWISTSAGLDRFRVADLVSEPVVARDAPMGYFQFVDSRGVVWIAGRDTVYAAKPGEPIRPVLKAPPTISAICEGPGGEIWVLSPTRDVRRIHRDGSVRRSALPIAVSRIGGCVKDAQERVWISVYEDGLLRYDDGVWRRFLAETRDLQTVVIGRDAAGRMISETRNALSRWDGDTATPISHEDRFLRGRINAIFQGPQDLLAGADGLVRVVGNREQLLPASRFPWLKGTTGISQSPRGETWLMSKAGVVLLKTSELERAFSDTKAKLTPRIFDRVDGLRGGQTEFSYTDIVIGGDGRVWASTNAGVFSIDPERLVVNRWPPPVVIRAVTVDGVRYAQPKALKLVKGARDLQIDFAALSLTAPERNRYLYMLEGYDKAWIDPGDRREAFYTNLSPGSYVFRVKAANNDGVWNEAGVAVPLELPPTFVQSPVFVLLIVATGALLLWVAYRLRIRQVTDKIRSSMQTRLDERERIARDLHDTLLQGVQGLLLKLHANVAQIAPGRVRQSLETAIDQCEAVANEARDRVRSLRAEAGGGLLESLGAATRRMDLGHGPLIDLASVGTVRDLRPEVVDEIEKIVTEALFNASRHAHASKIEVVADFGPRELNVRVSDDGRGIEPSILEAGRKSGHYGLPGMSERARELHGSLEIQSAAGGGTEVMLSVPAAIAYATAERRNERWSRFSIRREISEV